MARNDFYAVDFGGLNTLPVRTFQTEAAATAILPGEPVRLKTIGTSVYAELCADADPTIGTDVVVGIAASASTQTASADGVVDVYMPLPGVVYRGKAKSAAAADTDAEIKALANKRVIWDLTSSVWTIDTAAADGATNGIILTGTGDASTSEVDWMLDIRTTHLAY